MCLIAEHARALQRLEQLESEVARLKERYEPELPAGYPLFDVSWNDLVAELEALGLPCMLKPGHMPDSLVRHTDEESWARIMPFLVYPADYYVEGVADCDDYARWAAADSSKLFKLNGCLECWGDSQWGYHAFSLIRVAPNEYRISEPNAGAPWAGELLKPGEQGYNPRFWRL